MPEPIALPRFGEGVNSAELIEWLVAEGESFERGQDLAEVQTAKSVMTVAAPTDGVLTSHVAQPGDEMDVGDCIAWMETPGSVNGTSSTGCAAAPGGGPAPDTPHASASSPVIESIAVDHSGERQTAGTVGGAGFLSPRVAGRLAALGLTVSDLTAVAGSGRGGRLTAEDVQAFLEEVEQAKSEEASALRLAVADGMRRSWSRPLATVARRCRFDALLKHRRTVPGRPSATVYAARALGLALAKDDRLARRLVGKRLLHPESVAIAVAVEHDDGILLPVLGDADQATLADLTAAYDAVMQNGFQTEGAPRPAATVTNFGSLNLAWAVPIPPADQSLILGVGVIDYVPDWNPAEKRWGRCVKVELTLTFDHRVGDGAAAASLLHHIARLMENPDQM